MSEMTRPQPDPEVENAIFDFCDDAKGEMQSRMFVGAERGWGLSWRDGTYDDEAVMRRCGLAYDTLTAALYSYRISENDAQRQAAILELRKRAADVANQAFMLADDVRLEAHRE